jgi:hypothetical protein
LRATIPVVGLLIAGFACSGAGSEPVVCSPASSMGQLDTRAAGIAAVARDENHIAFIRNPVTVDKGCPVRGETWTRGTLIAATIQPDGSLCERVVASNVSQRDVDFSDDSRSLVFRQVDDCGVGNLQIADADGGNDRVVAGAVNSHTVMGAAVIYDVEGDSTDFAVPISGGTPVSIWTKNMAYGPNQAVNAPGTTFARQTDGTEGYGVEPGSLVVVPLASRRPRVVVDATQEGAGLTFGWSPQGGWLTFTHHPLGNLNINMQSLALVAADGTSRTELSAACRCSVIAFAPDDSWMAWDEVDSSGGVRLMTHSLKDGSNVALGVIPPSVYPEFQFTDDGANVFVMAAAAGAVLPSMYGATVGVADSLKLVSADVAVNSIISAEGGHAAFSLYPENFEVVPLSGGAPVILPGGDPVYEPGVSDPHLLFSQGGPLAIGVARGDGSGATFHVVPDATYFHSYWWLGSTVIYTIGPSEQSLTLTALSNAGTVSTELARGVSAYASAAIPAPTRLLYSRAVSGPDGPAGLWVVDLPR